MGHKRSSNTSIESSYNEVELYIKSKLYYHNIKLQLINQSTASFTKSRASGWLGKRSTFLNHTWDRLPPSFQLDFSQPQHQSRMSRARRTWHFNSCATFRLSLTASQRGTININFLQDHFNLRSASESA